METKIVKLPAEVQVLAERVATSKKQEVMVVLSQIFSGTDEWQKQIDSIVVKDVSDKVSIQMADAARKNVKNARLAAEKLFDQKRSIVQQAKAEWDIEDKLWLKAKQIMQITLKSLEEKADFKAKTVQRYEAEQKAIQTGKRREQVSMYAQDVPEMNYSDMTEEVFELYLAGLKKHHEEVMKERKRIDEEEKAKAAEQEAERQRILAENEKLRKEQEVMANKAREEAAERAKLEETLRLQREAEAKAAQEEVDKIKAQAMAPDKDKLLAFAKKIEGLAAKEAPVCATTEAQLIVNNSNNLLFKIVDYIEKRIQTLS